MKKTAYKKIEIKYPKYTIKSKGTELILLLMARTLFLFLYFAFTNTDTNCKLEQIILKHVSFFCIL